MLGEGEGGGGGGGRRGGPGVSLHMYTADIQAFLTTVQFLCLALSFLVVGFSPRRDEGGTHDLPGGDHRRPSGHHHLRRPSREK